MKKGLIATVVVVLCLLGLGFFQYQQLETGAVSTSSLSALSSAFSAGISSDADIAEVNQLLGVLDQVSNLAKLDTGLFSMPNYVLLRDFSVTLYPAQSVGRTNPFLGIDESPTTANAIAAPTRNGSPVENSQSTSTTPAQETTSVESVNQQSGTTDIQALQQAIVDTQQAPPSGVVDASAGVPDQNQSPPACDPFVDPTCFDFSSN